MDNFSYDEAISLATALLSHYFKGGSSTINGRFSHTLDSKDADSWSMPKDKALVVLLILARVYILYLK